MGENTCILLSLMCVESKSTLHSLSYYFFFLFCFFLLYALGLPSHHYHRHQHSSIVYHALMKKLGFFVFFSRLMPDKFSLSVNWLKKAEKNQLGLHLFPPPYL